MNKNEQNKTGLILEGGANRGVFTCGVLDFFQKKKIYLPYVASVSVGTCNAMDYISKQPGRTKQCFIPGKRNIPPIHWKHIRHLKTIVNLDMVFDDYPNRLVPFDYEAYFASDVECEYVVTNCVSGKADYLTEHSDGDRLMSIGRASSSLPFVCPMVSVDGKLYLDGGIADPIPVRRAMSRGCRKNIVILTRAKGYRKKTSGLTMLLCKKMYSDYPGLIQAMETRARLYNKTVRYLEKLESEGKVLLIRPSCVLAGRADNNPDHLEAFYRQGYELARDRYEEICKFLETDV